MLDKEIKHITKLKAADMIKKNPSAITYYIKKGLLQTEKVQDLDLKMREVIPLTENNKLFLNKVANKDQRKK